MAVEKRNFYIFGHNIAHSLSPTIHNSAFAECDLPYHYSIIQSQAVHENVKAIIRSPDFGGASVTLPHKLSIGSWLDGVSETARLIGAVNTIVRTNEELIGDNTDWLGILNVLERNRVADPKSTSSLVIGAGSAARAAVFALQRLGVKKVATVNRTDINAKRLATLFPSLDITTHLSLDNAPNANIIIGCIPADDLVEDDIPRRIFDQEGVVVEMSYRPPVSALMKVAKQRGWKVADGAEVLKQQAYAQFSLWTGRSAPVSAIEKVLAEKSP